MRFREEFIVANGLKHHVLVWEPERPVEATVLCAHGFLDVGFSFRSMAEELVRRGRRVVAFDWRGHGQTEWIGAGGYYHFFDYVPDLASLVEQLVPGPLHLVGHSMGGVASCLYAGSHPSRVEKLVIMEGLGPPEQEQTDLPERTARWVQAAAQARKRSPRVMASLEEALSRMRLQTPELPDELGVELARASTRQVEGGYVWSFDPLHRTRGPYPFRLENFLQFLSAIECPVLEIEGERGFRPTDIEERRGALRTLQRRVELPAVGHMMHWLAPKECAAAIDEFLG